MVQQLGAGEEKEHNSHQIEDWQDGQSCPETSGEIISSKSQADSLTQTCPG